MFSLLILSVFPLLILSVFPLLILSVFPLLLLSAVYRLLCSWVVLARQSVTTFGVNKQMENKYMYIVIKI